MFIIHSLVYLLFAFIMYLLAAKSINDNNSRQRIDKYLWMYIIFFSFIAGIRYEVGTDCYAYKLIFELGYKRDELRGEYLFSSLAEFVKYLGFHSSIGLGICAFLQIYPLVKICKDYKYILLFLPFALFGGAYFLDLMNTVRQGIVCCIIVYASKYLVNRNIIKYLFWVFIGSLFHHSALFLIVLLFIPTKLRIADRRFLLLCIFFGCLIFGFSPKFNQLGGYVDFLFGGTEYDDYVGFSKRVLDAGSVEVRSFGLTQISWMMTAVSLIIFGPQLERFYSDRIPYFKLWYLFSFLYGSLYFLLCNTSHIFLRPVMYLQMFQMICVSLLFYLLFRICRKKSIYSYSGSLLMLIVWASLVWNIIKALGLKNETTIYKIFLFY